MQKQRDAPTYVDSLDDTLLVEESDSFAEGEGGEDVGCGRGDLVGFIVCVEGIRFVLQELLSGRWCEGKYHHSQNRNRR